MRRLLYYIPGKRTVDDATIRDAGITGGIEGMQYAHRLVEQNGPDGTSGVLFVAYTDGTAIDDIVGLGFYAERQTWKPCNGGKFWAGYFNDGKPGPDELRRDREFTGYPTTLQDGAKWTAPRVLPRAGGNTLPYLMTFNAAGELDTVPLPEYAPIMQGASEVWEWVWNGSNMTGRRAFEIACLALGLNYYVGFWEASTLALLSSRDAFDVAEKTIDVPEWAREMAALELAQKKTDPATIPDGLPTGYGVTDTPPATESPTQTSYSTRLDTNHG